MVQDPPTPSVFDGGGLSASHTAMYEPEAARVLEQLYGIRGDLQRLDAEKDDSFRVIVDGKAEIALNRELGGRRIRLPMVAVDSVGAGGGSIARLSSGALTVGPQSAGASPGPACYGRGGEAATVSDADLLLGYLNPGRTLGKAVTLSPAAAEAAVGRLRAATSAEEVRDVLTF